MINSKKQVLMIVGIFTLILALTTVTYAFFNYTRTGSSNVIRTGQIYFSFEQDNRINLTNMFPVSSEEIENEAIDAITVGIKGNTTYNDGEEFAISIVDVNNHINSKNLPITYVASYKANENKTIGTASNDYWNNRNTKNSNIYLLNETGNVREGNQILVGYIDNEGSGIDGTLTIKAFIDKSRMVITDTYPSGIVYRPVENLSNEKLEICAEYFADLFDSSIADGRDFCSGNDDNAISDNLDSVFKIVIPLYVNFLDEEDIIFLEENGIVEKIDNGTTTAWVDGKTVFTTSEWNSFQNNPVSFKIKAESNEGIWVNNNDNVGIESCAGCKFLYSNDDFYTTWNTKGKTPSVITSGLSDYYLDVIDETNLDYFLGIKLNNNNQVTNVYACGIKSNNPFCIESSSDGSKHNNNSLVMQSSNLWGNNCERSSNWTICGSYNDNNMFTFSNNRGYVSVGYYYDDLDCWANNMGMFSCDHYYDY